MFYTTFTINRKRKQQRNIHDDGCMQNEIIAAKRWFMFGVSVAYRIHMFIFIFVLKMPLSPLKQKDLITCRGGY